MIELVPPKLMKLNIRVRDIFEDVCFVFRVKVTGDVNDRALSIACELIENLGISLKLQVTFVGTNLTFNENHITMITTDEFNYEVRTTT